MDVLVYIFFFTLIAGTSAVSDVANHSRNGTVFTAVFLDSDSHYRLLEFWNNKVPVKSNLSKVYAEHMTVNY